MPGPACSRTDGSGAEPRTDSAPGAAAMPASLPGAELVYSQGASPFRGSQGSPAQSPGSPGSEVLDDHIEGDSLAGDAGEFGESTSAHRVTGGAARIGGDDHTADAVGECHLRAEGGEARCEFTLDLGDEKIQAGDSERFDGIRASGARYCCR